jgi:hypothetical protein
MKLRRSTRRAAAYAVQRLEQRILLSTINGGGPDDPDATPVPAGIVDVQTPAPVGATTLSPLSSVPLLHSYPSATAQIYLDFIGAPAQNWAGRSVPATPAFDQDGDPTTFSAGELAAIQQVFSAVAEAFSPFNLDVTTVAPGSLVHKQNMQVVIGGTGSWSGAVYGGLSYTGAFVAGSLPNVSWVFSQNLGNNPAYVAQATAHEAGHELTLNHQSTYSGTTLTAEYNPGNALTAPIMGNSYAAQRGLWWYGASDVSSASLQDDLSNIASAYNGFGYRPLTYGQSTASAAALGLGGGSFTVSGVIDTTAQGDYFRLTVPAGAGASAAISLGVAPTAAMLHGRLQLLDASGTLLADADNPNTLSQSLTATLAPGTYYLLVKSFGQYGDVGQYTLAGTLTPPPATIVGRYVFYNNSVFDGMDPGASVADGLAIATDKQALLPGQTAQYSNVTSYTRGINGITVDLVNLPGAPTLNDFSFVAGTGANPATWAPAPTPTLILVLPRGGVGGSTRVELLWPDGSIVNQWLGVTMKATANTGLKTPDVFYFGNLIGSSVGAVVGGAFTVGPADFTAVSNDLHTFLNPSAITGPNDFNRDGRVDATDEIIARYSAGHSLAQISPSAALAIQAPAAATQSPTAAQDPAVSLATILTTDTGGNTPRSRWHRMGRGHGA